MTARTSLYTVDLLGQEDAALLRGVADLLVVACPSLYGGDVTQALADVVQFAPEDLGLVARDTEGTPIGWLRAEHFPGQASAEIKLGGRASHTATARDGADPRHGSGGADARPGLRDDARDGR